MRRAPLGAVLGPVPLWAATLVLSGTVAGHVVRRSGGGGRPLPVGGGAAPADAATGPSAAGEMLRAGSGIGAGPCEVAEGLLCYLATSPWAGGSALGLGLLGGLVLVVVAGRYRQRTCCPPVIGLLALLVATSVAWAGVALRADAAAHGTLTALAATGGAASFELTVVSEPRSIASGWQVIGRLDGEAATAGERAAFVLEAEPPALGDRLTVVATARPVPEGGYGDWLAQQHVRVSLDVQQVRLRGPGGSASRATEWLRARVRAAATRHLDDRHAGLLVGFVTGDTRLLPVADREAMQATSLTHLTAVSGTNVAIVVAGVLGVAGIAGLGVVGRRVAVALVVPWFAFLTRFEPSVLRAGTMALLLLLASTRGQLRDARHALAVAVSVLVLLDPRLAGSLGLVLSATATAGVLVLAPALRARLPHRIPRRLATLLSVTLGAQIAVLPALLLAFGELSLASVPANLLAVPAAMVAATLAFVGTALAAVSVELAAMLFALAGPGAAVVLTVAGALEEVGWRVELARPATVVAVVAAVVAVLAVRAGALRRVAVGCLVLALVVLLATPLLGATRPAGLRVTAIDVGQGDAFLVESPHTRVLIDAGEDDRAARWLRQHGRRHLDLLVVTHPHLDHVGGVPAVLRDLSVGALWWRPLPTELPQARATLEVAAARAVPTRVVERGEQVRVGDLDIEVLHPPPGRPYRWARSELNETSTVLRIHHAGVRALITGDVEAEAQRDLLAAVGDRLQAEILTVPHHGAATSDEGFLAHVGAEVALISVGTDNRHGHPSPSIIQALAALEVEVRRTDLEGTVAVEVPASTTVLGRGRVGDDASRGGVQVVSVPSIGDSAVAVAPALWNGQWRAYRHGRGHRQWHGRWYEHESGDEDGRVPAVPTHGHTGADPAAVLARGARRGGWRCRDDRHRQRPDRGGGAGPRPHRGTGVRGAVDRAVPHPLRPAGHGEQPGRRGSRAGLRCRNGPRRLRGLRRSTAGAGLRRRTRRAAATGPRRSTTTRWPHTGPMRAPRPAPRAAAAPVVAGT